MSSAPLIELREVTVTYGDQPALENVTLTVYAGEHLALLGPNGSGKTTLLKTIVGLIRPISGTVRVFGVPPWELGNKRGQIGYVPQVHQIDLHFPLRVFDAVLMGRYGRIGLVRRPAKEDLEATWRALERVGIRHLARRSIGQLSGGQRQRVFIARALATEPALLLLDEPTTGVDVATTESLYEFLMSLQKEGLTIVVASHDVGVVAQYVDRVACLNRQLVAHGRPEEVLGGEVLECMYGPQAAFLGHGQVPHMVVARPPHQRGE
ncbi:MAG: metal ABC transporter ATP-binding protein [Chloroflexi bacterium]|nr:metal ABC transporter ATP-binding protein [Chloroflexota bacterium]